MVLRNIFRQEVIWNLFFNNWTSSSVFYALSAKNWTRKSMFQVASWLTDYNNLRRNQCRESWKSSTYRRVEFCEKGISAISTMHVLDSACNLKEFQKLTLKNCLNYFYHYFGSRIPVVFETRRLRKDGHIFCVYRIMILS